MASQNPRTVRTARALAIAGVVDAYRWHQDVNRGLFPEAPPARRGCPRQFALDDVICLRIWTELERSGFKRQAAADIATQTRRLLRQHDELDRAYVVREETATGPSPRVVAAPDDGAMILMSFSIASCRASLEAAFVGFAS